jgi:hypothetical protein
MSCSSTTSTIVLFRGGFSADWAVVSRLLEVEARGGRFELLTDGRISVRPAGLLTADDAAFLRQHRDEARRVIQHQTDDSHLFTDARQG